MNNEDKNKPQQLAGVNQYAYIWNYNAHVEHQHNYYGGKPEKERAEEPTVQLIDFKFFKADRFYTMERQQVLRSAVNGVLPRMDTESGRDWVAVYIAYHYYMERELIMKCHADFFADIDRLLPGVLKRVNKAETGADKRYKAYTDTLRLECKCWFILNECLPPMQEWTSAKYPYPVDDDRRKRIQKLVIEIYQRLKKS